MTGAAGPSLQGGAVNPGYFAALEELHESGIELAEARAVYAAAKDRAIRAAKDAKKAGVPETKMALQLRVDRARTLRKWLAQS